jgi:hypothetical protein
MAGIAGNRAWVGIAKQTAKGTPAAAPIYKMPFTGGNIGPDRTIGRLQETDSSRDQGTAYVQRQSVSGSPEVYVRDTSLGMLLLGVLGADAVTGATNFTHTFTAAAQLPYMTLWKNSGDLVYDRYQDVFIGNMTVRADAGNPLVASFGATGLVSTFANVDPAPATPLTKGAVYTYNDAAVTLGGGATSSISSFELTIENNVNVQQTDDVTGYDVIAGTREVTLGFDMLFETDAEYRKFHTGTASGTAVSPNIYTTSMDFTFAKGVNNSVDFSFPVVAYEEFPLEPQASGDPFVVAVRTSIEPVVGASVMTAILKNQVATY